MTQPASHDSSAFAALGVTVNAEVTAEWATLLTPEAVSFLAGLHRAFEPVRQELLRQRIEVQEDLDEGFKLDFASETASIRSGDWKVAAIPPDLLDRRVEITGPVDRKMIINALNSGARVFMADFEDSNSPTWANCLNGQFNLREANQGTLSFVSPEGKSYQLGPQTAVLMVRPRGWHLDERHLLVDGKPISASLFDFGLYFFHNAKLRLEKGTAPYFYLPKMEHYLEARLWNDVFVHAQKTLGIPQGSVRATVLIETITAAFQMDEILYELREHSAGLNCGRWDYIFSYIKKFRMHHSFLVPDRAQVTMEKHFLGSYVKLLIQTCHRRGAHAMGGMAAQIPIKGDAIANEAALEKVRNDKLREVKAGHDGTWVAHPGLIPIAVAVFNEHMPEANQIAKQRPDVVISSEDLLKVPEGTITEPGLRINIDVGIQYLESWLQGNGCVPIYNLMEDAATAEISRTQVWQWLHHHAAFEDGRKVTVELVKEITASEVERQRQALGERFAHSKFERAAAMFLDMMTRPDFPEFLTLIAYQEI